MKQRVTIGVIPSHAGEAFIANAQQRLEQGSMGSYLRSEAENDRMLLFSEHMDFWSMFDSFDRFLRPKSHTQTFEYSASQVYVIRRDLLRLRASPRDDEERLLRNLLASARTMYRGAAPEGWLIVLREVLGNFPDLDVAEPA